MFITPYGGRVYLILKKLQLMNVSSQHPMSDIKKPRQPQPGFIGKHIPPIHDLNKKPMTPDHLSPSIMFKATRIIVIVIIIIGSVLISIGITLGTEAKIAYTNAMEGKEKLNQAQISIKEQNLGATKIYLLLARRDFIESQRSVNKLSWLKALPILRRQILVSNNLFDASIRLTHSLENLISVGESILSTINQDNVTDFHSLSPEQKGKLLGALYDSQSRLKEIQGEIIQTQQDIDNIPEFGVVSQLKEAKHAAAEKIPQIIEETGQVIIISEVLPIIGGYDGRKTYLFLYQNEWELRPTGGFLGTYGLLDLENGEIINFVSDDTYNLDKNSTSDIRPPEPIVTYMKMDKWYLRDSNWSPDFPTSARKAEEFYHAEGGQGQLAGVIAITPNVLQQMLSVTGPITLEGYPYEFTEENAFEQLEWAVERGYRSLGIPLEKRKDIIGHFSNAVLDKIFALPKERWFDFAKLLEEQFNQKHAMLYMHNENVQRVIADKGWDGRLRETEGDFAIFVDANLASLKTDAVLDRTIEYELDATNPDDIHVKMTVKYNHTGDFDWKTTRYRTYARLYAPEGSEFISLSGQDREDGQRVEVSTELGKTVFGVFKSIEPGTSEELTIEYRLPESIVKQIQDGSYTLLLQKQSGTRDHALNIRLKFDRPISTYSNEELAKLEDPKTLLYTTDLTYDHTFSLQLE